jgi:ribonuclease HIII
MRIVGIDESGKGDFFGPLVIAAFVCAEDQQSRLVDLGVRDSKKITDKRAEAIASGLESEFDYALVLIGPEKYNELYAKIRNLNKLLAWGHARAIENILEKSDADRVISDKFADARVLESSLMARGKSVEVQQLVRGEQVLQVAAASIIARAAFVRHMKALSAKVGIDLPKGASALVDQAGRNLVERHGPDILSSVAKMHFKNRGRILG